VGEAGPWPVCCMLGPGLHMQTSWSLGLHVQARQSLLCTGPCTGGTGDAQWDGTGCAMGQACVREAKGKCSGMGW